MSALTGVIQQEATRQKQSVLLHSEVLLANNLTNHGWVDCSNGAQMIWVHPDLRNPADGDQVFVMFLDAVEIQSRWELGWPDVHVNAMPCFAPGPDASLAASKKATT